MSYFHKIFHTICTYLPLVIDRYWRKKRSSDPENFRICKNFRLFTLYKFPIQQFTFLNNNGTFLIFSHATYRSMNKDLNHQPLAHQANTLPTEQSCLDPILKLSKINYHYNVGFEVCGAIGDYS